MVDLDTFFPEVEPECELAPLELMRRALRNSLRRLCEIGMIWRYTPDPAVTVANQQEYAIPYKSVAAVRVSDPVRVLRLAIAGNEIFPQAIQWLDRANQSWRTNTVQQGGSWYTQKTSDSILLTPYLVLGGTPQVLTWEVALMPSQDAVTIDDELYIHWRQAAGYGAKHELMSMSNKKWTNKAAATDNFKLFARAQNDARSRFEKSFTGVGQVARPLYRFA